MQRVQADVRSPVAIVRLSGRRRGVVSAVVVACAAVVVGGSQQVLAAAITWDGGAGVFNWQTGANWVGDVAPVANDVLQFDGAVGVASNNDFAAGTQFNGISFLTTSGAFTLSGNAVNLGGNILSTSTNVNAQVINLGLSLQQNTIINNSGLGGVTLGGAISSGVAGTGIIKTGTGGITLGGANTYASTTIREGSVTISAAGSVLSSSTLTLGGIRSTSPATITSSDTGGATQAFASTHLLGGRAAVASTRASGSGTVIFEIGTITRDRAAILSFTSSNSNNKATGTPLSNGIIGGWATFGSDFATLNASNVVVAYTGYASTAGVNPVIGTGAASNVKIAVSNLPYTGATLTQNSTTITVADATGLQVGDAIGGGGAITGGDPAPSGSLTIPATAVITAISGTTVTISLPVYRSVSGSPKGNVATGITLNTSKPVTLSSGVTDVNTIQTSDLNNRVVDIGVGNTLRLGATGTIFRADDSGINGLLIRGGTLTAGGADNTPGELILNGNIGSSSNSGANLQRSMNSIAVESVISDNGTGKVSVTKTGAGTTLFTADNSYTGETHILQGRLLSTTAGGFGDGDVYVYHSTPGTVVSGMVELAGAGTYANNFFIGGTGTTMSSGNVGALVTGNGTVASGTITMLDHSRVVGQASTASTLSGQITGDYTLTVVGAGATMTLSNPANNWSGGTIFDAGSATAKLILGASEVIPNGSTNGNFTIAQAATSGGAVSTVDMNGQSETINALISSGAGVESRRLITNGVAGTVTLTMGDGDASGIYVGRITSGAGAINVVKTGTGTQGFTGVSSYTGSTTVSGGTLLINNVSGSGTGTGNVTVDPAGTLGGAGFIDPSTGNGVIVNGTLSPGNSIGTLTVGAAASVNTLAINGVYAAEVAGDGTSDLAKVFGDLSFGGSSALNIIGSLNDTLTYTIATYTGASTGTFGSTNLPLGWVVGYGDGSNDAVTLSYVPEPASLTALGLLVGGLLRRRR